jgi:hypothetical protein
VLHPIIVPHPTGSNCWPVGSATESRGRRGRLQAVLRRAAFLQAALFDHLRLLVVELGEFTPRPTFHSQQLVQLGVDGLCIAMLGALNDEGHQPRCDGRDRRPTEAGWTDREPGFPRR